MKNDRFIYIYTDIIKPAAVSHQSTRLLRVIPIIDSIEKNNYRFENTYFFPLERLTIFDISIELTDGLVSMGYLP